MIFLNLNAVKSWSNVEINVFDVQIFQICKQDLCAVFFNHDLIFFLPLSYLQGAYQPEDKLMNYHKGFFCYNINLKRKKIISMPLMMEKPVRSPMVPPMRLSWASNLIFLSLSISSKEALSKKISTTSKVDSGKSSPEKYFRYKSYQI